MATKVLLKNREITTLPMIPMRGVVVFPDTVNHFDVSRKRSINAIEQAMKNRTPIFLLTQRDVAVDEPQIDDMFRYGVVADVKQILRITDDIIKVLVNCNYRAKIIGLSSDDEFYYAQIAKAPIHRLRPDDKNDAEALVRTIREQLDDYMEHYPKISGEIIMSAYASTDPSKLVEFLAFNLNFDYAAKQRILSESSVIKRLQLLLEALVKENNVLNIEREINDKVQESIDKNQREYYLREQIRTISTELGDTTDTLTEADEYRKKITALPLEDTYKTKLQKEVERLVQTPANSQESAVIRTYLDTVVELPWSVCSDDNFDLKNAEKILDRDHFGLEKVKERILEFLAVRSLTGNFGAQIICLVGPPGVGKTSIARSVAECMNRKFVRMSLGGIKDESEIRGHRRTYVASMPGRIIASIEQAGTSNPVILLDEIDKLGNDFRGDPASALLEVLDPEQNNSFRDHFLDLPYDLSKVLFLTTANDRGAIPGP
ncbi:MAG: LON peptidase substrate-binding domain-containing protein, partial [Oscillospiraceae bacterium]